MRTPFNRRTSDLRCSRCREGPAVSLLPQPLGTVLCLPPVSRLGSMSSSLMAADARLARELVRKPPAT